MVGNDADGAVVFIANDAAVGVFAGQFPALIVEGVAVAVIRWVAEDADLAVFFGPAQLAVVGDVTPDEIAADAVPCGAFGPEGSCEEALHRSVGDDVGL